ncbi:M48 family metallopeptidase [Pontibacter sp. G13]|uniref:M48 family metallopeptidase n=1 Tax=Pontibacter sp. G13 TaxID=3074898 RepID=UPI002889E5FF|nr:M48 family metallopeptidase [Pontibacter sp. G13]WNJ19255.1 M48 family metallopeptidase [Pontibacter sp. G13]
METKKTRKTLSHLYTYEYEHPFDRDSLDRLERTRGLEMLTQRTLDWGLEKYLLIKATGDNIQVTQSNIPELYELLLEACRILAMPEIPELYIQLEDKITSFTSGEKRRVIVISSGAVDLLNDAELLFLIGRELGHIKSNHVLYRMMADSLKVITQLISDVTLGVGNLLSMPLQIALMHWYRMSEFTADRAGLLTCQDPDVAANSFIKIAGLPVKYHGRVTVDDLKRQAHKFDNLKESNIDKLIRFVASYENPQPFTIIRASQLFRWIDAGEYERLLKIESAPPQISPTGCPNCKFPFEEDDMFCQQCGYRLR